MMDEGVLFPIIVQLIFRYGESNTNNTLEYLLLLHFWYVFSFFYICDTIFPAKEFAISHLASSAILIRGFTTSRRCCHGGSSIPIFRLIEAGGKCLNIAMSSQAASSTNDVYGGPNQDGGPKSLVSGSVFCSNMYKR